MERGMTVLELIVLLGVVAVASGIALPRMGAFWDWLAVDRATSEVAMFYQAARAAAVYRTRRVRLEFGQDSLRAVFEGPADSVFLRWTGPSQHGVRLTASRAVIRIESNGLGYGAANTKLVLTKAAAAESLTTSRLGRLKRWR
jgi:Tfp pilus assembly protein FimT